MHACLPRHSRAHNNSRTTYGGLNSSRLAFRLALLSSSLSLSSPSSGLSLYLHTIRRVLYRCLGEAQATIDELHSKGKWVACYVSAGTVETWREDAGAFPSDAVGSSLDGRDGERYLDITHQVWRAIRTNTHKNKEQQQASV